ncbi:MAG: hypothetical protein U5K55_14810 [Aliarcobacter sp.]|nr:hypothetical protein [Aliarcobacter sp.]
MLNKSDRKKVLLFLENIHQAILKSEENKQKFKDNYDCTMSEIEELIKNKDNEYSQAHLDSLKKLFNSILTFISKTSLDIVAVHSHNIAVSDFVEIAEKLQIEKELIIRAVKKR